MVSVDPEVALAKLAQAGEGAKFCDDSFAPTPQSLGSATLEAEVECWARPEAFGIPASRSMAGPVLFPAGGLVSDVEQVCC